MKKIFLLFSLLYSINIYSQMISDVHTNITNITFSTHENCRPFSTELSKFKVNNEKTLISFKFPIDSKHYTHMIKEYSFDNDSLILKLEHIKEKSRKWFSQSIELDVCNFSKTISNDKYGKFNFYCTNKFFGYNYKVYWFLDDILIAIFDSSNVLCTIDKIIKNILCVNEYIELKKKKESIELKNIKKKQEKIDLLQ